ncbi:MAG: response regulator [Bacteroidota bacterium]
MKKIMLVDDDTDLLLLLRHVLKAKGYLVIIMEDGTNVLAVIDTLQPDLLVMDINRRI